MELNTCLILASSNFPDIATKGPDRDGPNIINKKEYGVERMFNSCVL